MYSTRRVVCVEVAEDRGKECLPVSDARGPTTANISWQHLQQNSTYLSTWQDSGARTWQRACHSPSHKLRSGTRIVVPR